MKRLLLIALFGFLAACSSGDHEDLKQWMADNTKDMQGGVPKLPEVKPYEPVPYDVDAMLETPEGRQKNRRTELRIISK